MPSSVVAMALLPYLPARFASPDAMRARRASKLTTAAATSSSTPRPRLPKIQPISEWKPVPLSSTTSKLNRANTTPTRPSAASSVA